MRNSTVGDRGIAEERLLMRGIAEGLRSDNNTNRKGGDGFGVLMLCLVMPAHQVMEIVLDKECAWFQSRN
jgi:hypothetical protein